MHGGKTAVAARSAVAAPAATAAPSGAPICVSATAAAARYAGSAPAASAALPQMAMRGDATTENGCGLLGGLRSCCVSSSAARQRVAAWRLRRRAWRWPLLLSWQPCRARRRAVARRRLRCARRRLLLLCQELVKSPAACRCVAVRRRWRLVRRRLLLLRQQLCRVRPCVATQRRRQLARQRPLLLRQRSSPLGANVWQCGSCGYLLDGGRSCCFSRSAARSHV